MTFPRAYTPQGSVPSHVVTRRVTHWRPRWRWLPAWLPKVRPFGHYEYREYQVIVLDVVPSKGTPVFIRYETEMDE